MKKIISVAFILFAMSVSAFAEKIDFSEMTLDELFALRSDLNTEILNRVTLDSTMIYCGKYIIGKDIEPGMYIIYTDSPIDDHLSVGVYGSDHKSIFGEWVHTDEKYFLNLEGLESGAYLEIDSVQYAYLERIAKPEWMP